MVAAPVSARAVPARKARSAWPRLRLRCLPRCFITSSRGGPTAPDDPYVDQGAGGVARRGCYGSGAPMGTKTLQLCGDVAHSGCSVRPASEARAPEHAGRRRVRQQVARDGPAAAPRPRRPRGSGTAGAPGTPRDSAALGTSPRGPSPCGPDRRTCPRPGPPHCAPRGAGPADRATRRAGDSVRDSRCPRRPTPSPSSGADWARSRTIRVAPGAAPARSAARTSQPPGSGSSVHSPSDGSHRRPGDGDLGSAIRCAYGIPVTAAVQPSRSTTTARPTSRASTGAATARSCSSEVRCSSRSRASASLATESTQASVAGCIVSSGPLTSTTPISRPSRGSLMGAPVQVQEVCERTKCSEAKTWTGRRTTGRGADAVRADDVLPPVGAEFEARARRPCAARGSCPRATAPGRRRRRPP